MSIHNVTAATLDHVCHHKDKSTGQRCGKQQVGRAHPQQNDGRYEWVDLPPSDQHPQGITILVLECEDGHRESLNAELDAAEETSATRDDLGREQARNVRLLYRYRGLPVRD